MTEAKFGLAEYKQTLQDIEALRPHVNSGGWLVQHNGETPREVHSIFGQDVDYATFFDLEGRFIFKVGETEWVNFDRASVSEIKEVLQDRLRPFYRLVNKSLDNGHDLGFTQHGPEDHVFVVANNALALLDILNASEIEKKVALLIALGHDLGNIVSRKGHAVIKDFLYGLLPELRQSSFNTRVRQGVRLHDERIASIVMRQLRAEATEFGSINQEQYYQKVRDRFGVAALAVLIADKADAVDRRRVSRKNCNAFLRLKDGERITDRDFHFLTSALVQTDGFIVEENGSVLKQLMRFSPGQIEDDLKEQLAISSNDNRVKVPEGLHHLHRDLGIPHLFTWLALTLKQHGNRYMLESQALFALFPQLDSFVLAVTDKSDFVDYLHKGGLEVSLRVDRKMDLRKLELHLDDLQLKTVHVNAGWKEQVWQENEFVIPQVFTNIRGRFLLLVDQLKECMKTGEMIGKEKRQFVVDMYDGLLNFTIDIDEENLERTIQYLELLFEPKPHRHNRLHEKVK